MTEPSCAACDGPLDDDRRTVSIGGAAVEVCCDACAVALREAGASGAATPARVAVFGAAGHTGRFVMRELARRGFAVTAVGRDARRLADAGFADGTRLAEAVLDRPATIDAALAGAAAAINCAGPFLDTAEPVVAASLRARIPYLDVTAEQAAALGLFENHAAGARAAGVAVVPAMGFFGGLADLLVTAACRDWDAADAVRIGVALDSWHPTEGTRRTGRRNTVPRVTIADGALRPVPAVAPTATWEFAAPFGRQEMVGTALSEAILIAQHLRVGTLGHFLNTVSLRDLQDADTPAPVAVDDAGRSAQRFLVEVEVRRGDAVRRASAGGQDIYAVTAPLVAEALSRLIDAPPAVGGVFAPGALFDADAFLASLDPAFLSYRRG